MFFFFVNIILYSQGNLEDLGRDYIIHDHQRNVWLASNYVWSRTTSPNKPNPKELSRVTRTTNRRCGSGITLRQKCTRDNLNPQNCGTFFQLLDNLPANYCVQVYPREFTQLKAKDLLLFSVYCTFVVIIRKMQTIHGTSVNCCFTFRAINFFTASFVQQEIQDSDGQRFC